ncbi:MAG: hypothetical protein ACTSUK_07005, partial [Promethearchaeota archaeon]
MFNAGFSSNRSRSLDINAQRSQSHLGQFDFEPVRPLIELKADLFSILNTAQFLQTRFEKGGVDTTFYIRRMRFFYQQILQLQKELNFLHASIYDLIDGLPLEGNFRSLIATIAS